MQLNADFSQRAAVRPADHRWVPSPQAGVERVMLDRVGGERARATSLVRYAPHSVFPPHGHPGGEEILVLSGTFSDASGDHGPGWYLRNPPGSAHQPSSADGAVIFVKLWQMRPGDAATVRLDTNDPRHWQHDGPRATCPLHAHAGEQACLQRLAPGTPLQADTRGGAELLVLAGALAEAGSAWPAGSWLRLPAGATQALAAGPEGATLYLKTGHLADAALLAGPPA